mgnify:CR=1 FL=1
MMQLDFLTENWDTIVWALPGAWVVIILAVFWELPRIDFRVGSKTVVIECMGFRLVWVQIGLGTDWIGYS